MVLNEIDDVLFILDYQNRLRISLPLEDGNPLCPPLALDPQRPHPASLEAFRLRSAVVESLRRERSLLTLRGRPFVNGQDLIAQFLYVAYNIFVFLSSDSDDDNPLAFHLMGRGINTNQVYVVFFDDFEHIMDFSRFILEGEG